MTSASFGDYSAALSAAASSTSNVNDLNAFAAAAAAVANQHHSNNSEQQQLKMMNDCMMGTVASKRPDNNNVIGLSNLQEMDVMKMFQKNALLQPGFHEMEDKMNAASKKQIQSSQLINGMKRQMAMPNSMNAALQCYHEQLAACIPSSANYNIPPNAKRASMSGANAYSMPEISQSNAAGAGLPPISMVSNGHNLMAGSGSTNPRPQQNLMSMTPQLQTSAPSSFILNNSSMNSSMAYSMAQHNMMTQQMPPVSSYSNLNALSAFPGTINDNNSATAINRVLLTSSSHDTSLQQQHQQNFNLAAVALKHQNQLKAQQHQMQLQQQAAAKMHPQAMAIAQAAARAQAVREAQIMQQHQQRQQKIAASSMTAPLAQKTNFFEEPSSAQQGMNVHDYLTQRQLVEYTNLLHFQQQQQASLQQQQQMAQHQQSMHQQTHMQMQQNQQAALLAAAQQERRKTSVANPSVPMATPSAHSLATSSSAVQSLGSQLAANVAAAIKDTQEYKTPAASNGNKSSQPPYSNAVIVSLPNSSISSPVIGHLKGDLAVVVNGNASQISPSVSATSMRQSGPNDERFQDFLANIRFQYEQHLQQQAQVNKSTIDGSVTTTLEPHQLPKSDNCSDSNKSQASAASKTQFRQESIASPTCVDPVSI